ncbi:MAG: hypothetical protein IKA17_05425 [Clostridia bacterium]|nr:hypothetical protein [Clostridia bacterium]
MRKISKILSVILTVSLIFSVVLVPTVSAADEVYLTDLVFDGYTVQGFSKDVTSYTATLPYRDPDAFAGRSGETPVVTATAAEGCTYEVATTESAVTVTVSKEGAESKVYTINYTVVGANLLINPDFEIGRPDGWMLANSSKQYVRETGTHSPTHALFLGDSSLYYAQNVEAPAMWYVLTAGWARGNSGKTGDEIPSFYMGGNRMTVVDGQNYVKAQDVDSTYVHVIQAWEMKNFVTPSETLTNLTVRVLPDTIDAIPFFVDDLYAGVLVAGDIQINGVPADTITAANDIQLSAQVVNQFGTTEGILTQPTVSYRLVEAPAGVTIDSTGKVSFDPSLDTVGNIVVEAIATPNWGPAEQQAAQTIIGSRVTMAVDYESNMPRAGLSEIVFDGYSVPGFEPTETTYTLTLPYRDWVDAEERYIPSVTATSADGGTCVVGTPVYNAETKTGTVTITAKQDDCLDRVYTINYNVIGDNLLTNPDFEIGRHDGWMLANSSKQYVRDTGSHSPTHALFLGEANMFYSQNVEAPAMWYVLTAGWARGEYGKTGDEIPTFYMGGNRMTVVDGQNYVKAQDFGQTYVHVIQAWEMKNFVTPSETLTNLTARVTSDATSSAFVDDLYAGVLVAGDIQINAPEIIANAGETALNALVVNQFGTTEGILTQPTVSYRLVEAPAGVTVSAAGLVTVPADAAFGKIVVEATATPNWGPADQQAAQTVIGKRIEILAAVNAPCEFTYAYGEGTVTPTVNWFNKAEASKTVRAYTAVYENVNGAKKLKSVISNEAVTIGSGELYNATLTSVAWTNGEEVKSFLLADGIIPVMPAN